MPGDAFVELKLACYAELLCYLDDNNLVGQLAKLNLMQRPPNIQYYSSLCRPRPVCCGKILSNKTISDGGTTVDFWFIKIYTSN